MVQTMEQQVKLIAFLGNPGRKYAGTRHNIGRMVADNLSKEHSLSWQNKHKGLYTKSAACGSPVHMLQPETYMNKSGESIGPCLTYFSLSPGEMLVVHDEIELSFGTIDIKTGGGLGGHNGLRSIVEHIGTRDFLRLRIGVSRPEFGDVASYVLSNFSSREQSHLPGIITECSAAITGLVTGPVTAAMKQYRKKTVLQSSDKT